MAKTGTTGLLKSACEGWDSGPQVRFANSKFLLNFEIKTDLKLFVTQHKYKFA